jgi:hypothetical protein
MTSTGRKQNQTNKQMPGMVERICNPSTGEAESRRILVWDRPGLHSETPSQNMEGKERKKHFSTVSLSEPNKIIGNFYFLCLTRVY